MPISLRYGLELMERQEYELEAVDMGNLFHQSIDRCFGLHEGQRAGLAELTEEGRKSLVKECVTQVTEEYGNTIMSSLSPQRVSGRAGWNGLRTAPYGLWQSR